MIFGKQNLTDEKYCEVEKEFRNVISSYLDITGLRN